MADNDVVTIDLIEEMLLRTPKILQNSEACLILSKPDYDRMVAELGIEWLEKKRIYCTKKIGEK